ncbi:hypothetical protein A3Q56_05576 [Intoshia linei]|uniref:Uncharacterized protein n=1 Tax=Intoshia linei TaxID=1819745 RepID=A0A177AZ76_9BILA|nr:hypothetical protein A3Q56_05576 [Intoshia linei]
MRSGHFSKEWQEKNHCDTCIIWYLHYNKILDEIICDSIDLKNQDALYFKEPQQLINLLSELEETNLSLIQNSQDTEESLKQVKNDMDKSETKMNEETNCLKQNIGILKEKINIEEIRSTRLKRFIDEYSSIGDEKSNVEDRTNILQQLHTEVENVYKNCVGEGNEASINTIQMLTNIENKLEKMFEIIECLPYEMVISAEKIKEKERRLFLRQEKILTQKKHQEERIQKALERAKAAPKKLTGRRVIERSNPPIIQKLNQEDNEEILRLQQELAYYFVE